MSPEEISRRLDIIDELSELAFYLSKGKPLGRVADEVSHYEVKEKNNLDG